MIIQPSESIQLGIEFVSSNEIAFLIELIPKDDYTTFGFRFLARTSDSRCNILVDVWCAEYDNVVEDIDVCFYDKELIDAIYKLIVYLWKK